MTEIPNPTGSAAADPTGPAAAPAATKPKPRRRMKFATRGALIRLAILFLVLGGLAVWFYCVMFVMPGKTFRGPLPPLTSAQAALRDMLRADVSHLAQTIGERNVTNKPRQLAQTADWLETRFSSLGLKVTRQSYDVKGVRCDNLEAVLPGSSKTDEIIVVGAHYDSVEGVPGANDNGSGVAALLAIAKTFSVSKPQRTLHFVAFTNEEPPWFKTDLMGSLVYARACKARGDQIAAVICMDEIGYYSDEPNSQQYPPPFDRIYPTTGNFIAFVGNYSSRKLVRQSVASFRKYASFPSEGVAMPELRAELGWSDHQSFWRQGYPALMVTDTAPFRYRFYHTPGDTPDRIDYDRTARVVDGLTQVVVDLANPD